MSDDPPNADRSPRPGVPRQEIPLDVQGRLAAELPCLSCGYILLGLDPAGTCPECMAPIARSVRGDLLRFCDPSWLDRVARGLELVLIGYLAIALLSLGVPLVVGFLLGTGAGSVNLLIAIAAFLKTALAIVVVLGVWFATSPDPGKLESEPLVNARVLARWGCGAQVVTAPLQYASPVSAMSFGQPVAAMTTLDTILTAAAMIFGLAVTVGVLAALMYLRRMAHRIPRPALAARTTVVIWGLGIASAVGILAGIAFIVAMPQFASTSGGLPATITPTLWVSVIGGCATALGLLVFGIFAIAIVFQYRRAVRKAAAQSRTTWSLP